MTHSLFEEIMHVMHQHVVDCATVRRLLVM